MQIKDYIIKEQIHNGSKSKVFRALDNQDNKPVVIKTIASEYPSQKETDMFRNQYDILKNLSIPGIIKMYELIKHQNGYAIIMEDNGGMDLRKILSNKKVDIETFLDLGIKLAGALGEIHDQQIIHKDIKPENVIITNDLTDLRIIDFGISTKLSQEKQNKIHENVIEGSLAYISPEQTGRMNRPVDYRTDFYSLGIMFYELLTGQIPFKADDALGMVHLHIARMPEEPCEMDNNIPKQVSDIIMKLLAKNAEDRYRSAMGLKADLENCRNQLKNSGSITEFPLAQEDYSSKFQISGKLYGREAQLKILLNALKQTTTGSAAMMLVSGLSGIGKSALIHEIYKPAIKQKGFFISGKYNGFKKNIPYSAIIQAFNELMHILLTKKDSQLARWKKRILEAVGQNGQVIIDVIPALELVIGKQPPINRLGPVETKNRFRLYFQRFIRVFTKKKHPLILFLDDLQWADPASLKLIKAMVTDEQTESLLILGSYRNNEVSSSSPLKVTIKEIIKEKVTVEQLTLSPLTISSVNQLLADSLKCTKKQTRELTELVFNKTKGNPFFIGEFMKSLYARNLLKFENNQGWMWDLEKIETLQVTSNVVELLAEKIKKESEEARELLKIASCIGNRFSLSTLVTVYKKSREQIKELLSSVMHEGFIFLQDDLYFFSHDRVQEAVYSLIPEELKKKIHYNIGCLELESTPEEHLEKKIFYIVDQLNFGIDFISDEQEQILLARLNLTAGTKAKESTAYEQALKYLQTGMDIAAVSWWTKHYKLIISLYTHGVEVAYLSHDYSLMNKLAGRVMIKSKNILDRVKVRQIKIYADYSQARYIEAIQTGKKILSKLGITLPRKPGKLHILAELIKTKILLSGKKTEELQNLPVMTDRRKMAAMDILMSIGSSAYYALPEMVPIIACKMIAISVKYGNSALSSYAYAAYGIVQCGLLGELEEGNRFGELALAVVDQFNAVHLKSKIDLIYNAFIRHWKHHLKDSLQPLLAGYKTGYEQGDFEYAGVCIHVHCFNASFTDKHRAALLNEAKAFLHNARQLQQITTINSLKETGQFILNLSCSNCTSKKRLKGHLFNEDKMISFYKRSKNKSDISIVYIFDLICCYLFGHYYEAVKMALKAERYINSLIGMIFIPNHNFYYSLSLLALYRTGNKSMQRRRLKQVRKNQKLLKKWARYAPMNYQHKYLLVEAEIARVLQQVKKAMDYYEDAIHLASEHEYIQEAAIGYECAARMYLELEKKEIAGLYMKKSHYYYYRWGAAEKVKQIENTYPELLSEVSEKIKARNTIEVSSSSSSTTNLDLLTILKASRALSVEITWEKLLKKMMKIVIENAGACRGILILENGGTYFVEAEAILGELDIQVMQSVPYNKYKEYSLKIVNYVLRTTEAFVTGEAIEDEHCFDDEYVNKYLVKSILCFPILHHSKLMALLYLENTLTLNAFTTDRLEILKSLSSQIAISLENARLYENLKEQERLKKEMEIAEHIQTAIVPAAPEEKGFEIAVSMTTAEEVGGDYYDIQYDKQGNLWFAIGDVSGHGVTSGLIMMMAQTCFTSILHEHTTITPREAIISVNRLLHNNLYNRLHAEHCMTMTFLKHLGDGNFLYSGSHVPVIIYRKDSKSCEEIDTHGVLLGIMPDISHATENSQFQLNKGDIMLLYTDGIIESRHKESRELLDLKGLRKILEKHAGESTKKIKDSILRETLDWSGQEVHDDITMIVVRKK